MLSEFGEKARAYRLRHGWLLYDMATVMRLSSATLSAYECGRKEVPEDVRQALDMLIKMERRQTDNRANDPIRILKSIRYLC